MVLRRYHRWSSAGAAADRQLCCSRDSACRGDRDLASDGVLTVPEMSRTGERVREPTQ